MRSGRQQHFQPYPFKEILETVFKCNEIVRAARRNGKAELSPTATITQHTSSSETFSEEMDEIAGFGQIADTGEAAIQKFLQLQH